MAMSPAKIHMQRAAARAGSSATRATLPHAEPVGDAYLLQRAALGVDLRILKQIQSTEKKIAKKRELLPTYDPWIEGVLAADSEGQGGAQDDIVTHVMIWRIDVGDFEGALPLAEYVLRHQLTLPERFTRTAATLIVEETAEAAFQALGQDQDFDLAVLQLVDDLTKKEDMPDQVRGKIEKAIGQVAARRADAIEPDADGAAGAKRAMLELALTSLKRAAQLDRSAGVKKETQRIERIIRDLAPPADTSATENVT